MGRQQCFWFWATVVAKPFDGIRRSAPW
jgi:hypothetical protein